MAEVSDVQAVLGEDFLDGIATRPTAELRELRRTCEEVESHLSYRRRMLHGHMDLLRAELERRGVKTTTGAVTELLGHLADGPGQGARSPSHQRFSADVAETEGGGLSADLPDRSDEELHVRGEELVVEEHTVSDMRRTVLDRLDAIQGEVLRRYRDGTASIDEILPPADA